jgi:hypothetical protein
VPTISLDQIKQDVSQKYEPLTVGYSGGRCELRRPILLSKEERQAVGRLQKRRERELKAQAAQEEAGADVDGDEGVLDLEDGQIAYYRELFTLVASNPVDAQGLLAEVGEDIAVLTQISSEYAKATQVGEA